MLGDFFGLIDSVDRLLTLLLLRRLRRKLNCLFKDIRLESILACHGVVSFQPGNLLCCPQRPNLAKRRPSSQPFALQRLQKKHAVCCLLSAVCC